MKPSDFCQPKTFSVISGRHPCRVFASDTPLPHQKPNRQLSKPYFWGRIRESAGNGILFASKQI